MDEVIESIPSGVAFEMCLQSRVIGSFTSCQGVWFGEFRDPFHKRRIRSAQDSFDGKCDQILLQRGFTFLSSLAVGPV